MSGGADISFETLSLSLFEFLQLFCAGVTLRMTAATGQTRETALNVGDFTVVTRIVFLGATGD